MWLTTNSANDPYSKENGSKLNENSVSKRRLHRENIETVAQALDFLGNRDDMLRATHNNHIVKA